MRIDILTLFPEMFDGPFSSSILKRAQERGLIEINLVNIRDFSTNKHHTVDDTPYGGGAGMVMRTEALFRAVEHVTSRPEYLPARVVLMSPQGRPLNQEIVREMSLEKNLILICGHYEGVDERVRESLVDDEISVGDYILTGGELPAMVLVDAVARLVPGVLGETSSTEEDSFVAGLLEYPHYTRPRDFRGKKVPEVLLGGHHQEIKKWRRRQSILRTLGRRPELLAQADLSSEDLELLKQIFQELKALGLD